MNKHYLKTLASSLLLAGLSPALLAANAITAIDLVNNSQNEPVLAISFAEAPTTPASFSIINPPRIAFDFKDTKNQTGKNLLPFNSELLNAATLVESSDRTRLVPNLNKSSAHSTRIDGKQLLVSFNAADKPLAAGSSIQGLVEAAVGARQQAGVDPRAEFAEVFRLTFANMSAVGGGSGTTLTALRGIDKATRESVTYWMALACVVAAISLVYLFLRSKQGLALLAIRDNEVAARSQGIAVDRMKLAVYAVAAFGAGLAGTCLARFNCPPSVSADSNKVI
mgnify:CR=1 FL=1